MELNRRNFIRLLGSSLLVPVVEPRIKYVLPPLGGWYVHGSPKTPFPKFIMPSVIPVYYEYLIEEGAFTNPWLDLQKARDQYLEIRAQNSIFSHLEERK